MTRGTYTVCSDALRGAIVAAPGNTLLCGDWSNIESRVLAWIANEEWKLEAYRLKDQGKGEDLYKLLFSQFFGVPVEQVTKAERQAGKAAELAFGYGGGVGALVTMAAVTNVDLTALPKTTLPAATPEQLKKAHKAWRRAFMLNEDYELERDVYMACDVLKQAYRTSNAAINTLRHDIDNATKTAIREPGRCFNVGRCKVWSTSTWLIIQLPNLDRLLYAQPRLEQEKVLDPDTLKESVYEYISYATARGHTWLRERAWSGLFVENIIQAAANRILRAALLRIHRKSLTIPAVRAYLATLTPEERTIISMHVHDEVVGDLPPGLISLEQWLQWMIEKEAWMGDLPLAAEGWENPRYGKR